MPAPFPSSYIHVLFKGLKHLRYEHTLSYTVRVCVRLRVRVCVPYPVLSASCKHKRYFVSGTQRYR